jgi:hypothetical protein
LSASVAARKHYFETYKDSNQRNLRKPNWKRLMLAVERIHKGLSTQYFRKLWAARPNRTPKVSVICLANCPSLKPHPVTGNATNRIIISHKPVNGVTIPDQPVHSLYALNNLGTYVPPPVGTNQALAASPSQSTQLSEARTAAAAPAAQQISSDVNSGNLPVVPSLNQQLASGMPQQAIIQQGGPLWASANGSPPLPSVTPAHLPAYGLTPQNINQTGGAPRALPVSASPSPTPYPAGNQANFASGHPDVNYDPTADDYYKSNFGGMTGQDVINRVNNPKNVSVVGPAETTPSGGVPPSQKVMITTTTGDK